jgi:hypothetical protein
MEVLATFCTVHYAWKKKFEYNEQLFWDYLSPSGLADREIGLLVEQN